MARSSNSSRSGSAAAMFRMILANVCEYHAATSSTTLPVARRSSMTFSASAARAPCGARLRRSPLLPAAGAARVGPRPDPLAPRDGGVPDAARRAVDEHGLALGEPPAELQREVRGVVVEDQARALRHVELA